ncbi:hypothetical protein NQZ68_005785 [Dissostichus eleginoides]|nr:hypothetical protein NQZ68_005785 [Dissostichus eleginoides]
MEIDSSETQSDSNTRSFLMAFGISSFLTAVHQHAACWKLSKHSQASKDHITVNLRLDAD